MLGVDADRGVLGEHDVLVEDGLVHAGAAVDDHAVEQDRVHDLRPGVDAHVRGEHRVMHLAAGDDDAGGDDRIGGVAQTVAACMHELGRRQVAGHRVDRPLRVVQVELGHIGDQVHMRIVELLERTHVAPVGVIGGGGAGDLVGVEVVDAGLVAAGEVRGDVAAHVVLRVLGLLVLRQRGEQGVGVGHVVAHRGQERIRIVRQAGGGLRLLLEALDHVRMVGIDLDHAELVRLADRLADAGHRELGAGLDMLLHHLAEVHAVHVVGADDDHDIRLDVLDDVDGLVDRVRGAEVPVLAQTLLRRDRGHVVAQQRREAPRQRDMAVQRVRLVLGEHDDLLVPGVDEVAQREVDQTEYATERHRRLGAIPGQRHQSGAFTAR